MELKLLKDSNLNFADGSPIVQRICQALEYNFKQVATPGVNYSSMILVGGAGFGDFNVESSDLDIWLIMSSLGISERLKRSKDLNLRYNTAKERMVREGVLSDHNFRHPPTILTEEESEAYRRAFAAKIGLPISLGVFPTLLGTERKGEACFTEEQLVQDLAYSCGVFQTNVLNPPAGGIEDPLRYCYKRATYFLRFKLFYEKGIYVPRQDQLLALSEQELTEWRPIIPILRQLHSTPTLCWRLDLRDFRFSVNEAMQIGMDKFWEDGIIDGNKIAKGDIRTKIHWTLEKLRWDFLLLQRDPEYLLAAMSEGGQKGWSFSFSQIDGLFSRFFEFVPESRLIKDWRDFRTEHRNFLSTQVWDRLDDYYDQVYHPKLVSFFDRATKFTNQLFDPLN